MCSVWPDVERLLSSLCPLREGWYLVDSRVSTALCSTASPRSYGLWDRNDSARRLTPGRSLIGWQANALLLLVESPVPEKELRSAKGPHCFKSRNCPSRTMTHLSFLHDRCLIPRAYRAFTMIHTSLVEIHASGNLYYGPKEHL